MRPKRTLTLSQQVAASQGRHADDQCRDHDQRELIGRPGEDGPHGIGAAHAVEPLGDRHVDVDALTLSRLLVTRNQAAHRLPVVCAPPAADGSSARWLSDWETLQSRGPRPVAIYAWR